MKTRSTFLIEVTIEHDDDLTREEALELASEEGQELDVIFSQGNTYDEEFDYSFEAVDAKGNTVAEVVKSRII